MFFGNIQPSFCHYDGSQFVMRAVRPGVGKYDVMFADAGGAKPLRYAIVDRDHSSIEPLWIALDGSGKVGVAGNFAVNGKPPPRRPHCPRPCRPTGRQIMRPWRPC
ncbi:hypothetical protein MOP88_13880 [Sphingomonas sp. WKB10]|nr:hypothetical protein [Sphingomonas sp. WKB10]